MRFKILFILFIVFAHAKGQTTYSELTITPSNLMAGQKATLHFRSNDSSLIKATLLNGGVYLVDPDTKYTAIDVIYGKKSNEWVAEITIPYDSSRILIANVFDTLTGKIYSASINKIFDANGQNTSDNLLAFIYSGGSSKITGIALDKEKRNYYLKQFFETGNFISIPQKIDLYSYQKDSASFKRLIHSLIIKNIDGTESDYNYAMILSKMFFRTSLYSDSLQIIRNTKFPDGDWIKTELKENLNSEPDLAKKQHIYALVKAKYPQDSINNSSFWNEIKYSMLQAYINEGNVPAALEYLPDNLKSEKLAVIYNDVACGALKTDRYIGRAIQLSKESIDLIEQEIINPRNKPSFLTTFQYKIALTKRYIPFFNTCAQLLFRQNQLTSATEFEKLYIEKLNLINNTDLTSFLTITKETENPEKIIHLLNRYSTECKLTQDLDSVLRVLNTRNISKEKYVDTLIAQIENLKTKAYLNNSLTQASGQFMLRDTNGKMVSLSDYKGKVVVLDFWATWCIPCIKSFPAVSATIEKYKANQNVVFLFINTFETAVDKNKNASLFLKNQKLNFTVLLDEKNVVAEMFNVKSIPAKIIIDQNQQIRFHSAGYEENIEIAVNQLSSMINDAFKN